MHEKDFLAQQFQSQRARLRAVAYRMLGSLSEADDAVQEAWLHVDRGGASGVDNLGGWLTTIVARVCLDMLRSRKARRDEPVGAHVPDPIVTGEEARDLEPERETLLADSIGLALLVVLETLPPAERLAFVLHDMFDLPFDEIATIVDRTPAAARQLASRARRRVQGARPSVDDDRADPVGQRRVVDAFLSASRAGSLEGLLAVLDPDVVLHVDRSGAQSAVPKHVRGAETVARSSLFFSRLASADRHVRPARVNGEAGLVTFEGGRPYSVMAFTIARGKIVEIHVFADPTRLARLDLAAFAP